MMERYQQEEAIERIRRMEACFDALQETVKSNPAAVFDLSFRELLQTLTQYYENGQWLSDYEMDEKGLLPQNLKRGVLAQDAVYDFLEQIGCMEAAGCSKAEI